MKLFIKLHVDLLSIGVTATVAAVVAVDFPDPLGDLEITEMGENDSGKVTLLSICLRLCIGERGVLTFIMIEQCGRKRDHQSGVMRLLVGS